MNLASLCLYCAMFSQLAVPPDSTAPTLPALDAGPAAPGPTFGPPNNPPGPMLRESLPPSAANSPDSNGNSVYGAAGPAPGMANSLPNAASPVPNLAHPATAGSAFQELPDRSLAAPPDLPHRRVESAAAQPPSGTIPGRTAAESAAKTLISQALTPPAGAALRGTPFPLRAALERVQGNAQQLAVVTAYWRLAHATATYHDACEEVNFLSGLRAQPVARQQATLKAAQATARAAQAEAYLAAIQAQHALAESAQLPGEALPLIVDAPFVGTYRTYFETLSARGAVPARLERLDRTLPVLREVLESHVAAIGDIHNALTEYDAAYQAGQVELATLLEFSASLRQARSRFLGTVRDYNEAIAVYALSVASPGGLTPERLVGMLVERPPTDHSVLTSRRDSGVRQVSNDQPTLVPVPRAGQ